MSAMVNLEIPWINVMSKMDLVTSNVEDSASGRNGIRAKKDIARYLDPDPMLLVSAPGSREERSERHSRFHSLNRAIVQLVSTKSYSAVSGLTVAPALNCTTTMLLLR